MSAPEFGQQFVNALGLGSIYALVAVGLAMVFGILRLINFAHGEVLMLGAFAAYYAAAAALPFWLVAPLAVLTTVAVGVVMERVAYRSVRGAPDVALLLTSLGVSIMLQNLGLLVFGAQPKPFPTPALMQGQIDLGGGVQISATNLVVVATALALMVALTFFVTRTPLGLSMRATAENAMAAQLMGINVTTVIVAAFVIGSGLAGVAGLLWGAWVGRIEPLMGFTPSSRRSSPPSAAASARSPEPSSAPTCSASARSSWSPSSPII